jgi:Heat induced stress protein YflT domain
MTTTVNGLFDTYEDASAAVNDIRAAGVADEEISVVANNVPSQIDNREDADNSMAGSGTADGAAVGGVVGGAAGLLAGLGAVTIPGIGPVMAAGWLLTTAVGAAVGASGGGILGALIGAGVSKDHAEVYVEGVRKGGTLVSARVADAEVANIEAIMTNHNAGPAHVTVVTARETPRPIPPAE